ncbi:LemA family protein [Proteus vulgaris]|uniref:LemA family protein n=1 Tax=Proteus TaxID=583 RepID=UPI000D68E881|nr:MULTISPECIES: LemA family protein [Proteus]MBQ0213209.1 LemA family protein [Proteus vulgaris]MDS0790339.1 LemA family protein [Proteus vulgaris]
MEWLIFIIFILALVYFLIRQLVMIYNNMVMLKNNCYKAFANIDVLLKKQADLIPMLIVITQKSMDHEKILFEKLAENRDHYLRTDVLDQKVDLANQLLPQIKKSLIIAEKYPELISGKNLHILQAQAKELEECIADRREFFNQSVTLYNTEIHIFPNVLFKLIFNFKDIPLFYPSRETDL